jgi:hypothetical protein
MGKQNILGCNAIMIPLLVVVRVYCGFGRSHPRGSSSDGISEMSLFEALLDESTVVLSEVVNT